jgi:hypothetical protein
MEYAEGRHIGDILKARERNIEIIGADLATRHGFTQVPNFILTSKEISVGTKLAYAMLLKYVWNNDACFPARSLLQTTWGRRIAASEHISRSLRPRNCWRSNSED